MIDSAPVERVVSLLEDADYVRWPSPVVVGSVPFDFSAVLVGTERAFDIVVVSDTVMESNRRLRQRIEALARALDVSGSRRSLTIVTVGPKPNESTMESLSRVARILVVHATEETDTVSLRDSLAVLLPLNLPSATDDSGEPFADVMQWLTHEANRAQLRPIVAASGLGSEGVSEALANFLAEPFLETRGPKK